MQADRSSVLHWYGFSLTGAQNDSARHGRSSCGILGCGPRSRANDDAVERKAGDKLQHVGRRDLRQRRSDNIEFHGDGQKRHSAVCQWTCQFGCADGAERRQADGSSPRLPSGFEAEISLNPSSRKADLSGGRQAIAGGPQRVASDVSGK